MGCGIVEKSFRLDFDLDRRLAPIQILWLSLERMKNVFVFARRLGCEVIPDKALHRMVERAHDRLRGWLRDDGREHFEAIHEVLLVLSRVHSLDSEAQQPGRICPGCIDGEGDGVYAADGEDLVAICEL